LSTNISKPAKIYVVVIVNKIYVVVIVNKIYVVVIVNRTVHMFYPCCHGELVLRLIHSLISYCQKQASIQIRSL
jgi:hypothetical protein